MKHLKGYKVFESSEGNKEVLSYYFHNITDDLSDICSLNINEITSNYFEVNISSTVKLPKDIGSKNVEDIDTWIEYNDNDSIILKELKSSISRLQDEDIIDKFNLVRTDNGYAMSVYTKITEDDDINEWIFVNDAYEAYIDEARLINYFKAKLDTVVSSATLQDDYGRHGDRYIELEVQLDEVVSKEKLKRIEKKVLGIKVDFSETLRHPIFTECYYSKNENGSDWISFILDESISDFL